MYGKTRTVLLTFGLVAALAGCSSYSAEPDQAGVHVNGSWIVPVDKTIEKCFGIDGKESSGYDGPGDTHYYYPTGQRTYKFAGKTMEEAKALGADGPAITVVKNNINLTLTGTVTFYLNTDCDVMQAFHREIGIKKWGSNAHAAWISDGDEEDYTGWNAMLDVYIEQPLQRAATDGVLAQTGSYLTIYNGDGRADLEKAIQTDLPTLVEEFSGGPYFQGFTVSLQKPTIPTGVAEALTAKEIAAAQNEAQKIANQTVHTELESIRQIVEVLGQDGYVAYQQNKLTAQQLDLLKEAIAGGKITILPIPTGSTLALPAN